MTIPFKPVIEDFREMIETFREECPGGITEYVRELRKDRAERRAMRRRWKKLTLQERAFACRKTVNRASWVGRLQRLGGQRPSACS